MTTTLIQFSDVLVTFTFPPSFSITGFPFTLSNPTVLLSAYIGEGVIAGNSVGVSISQVLANCAQAGQAYATTGNVNPTTGNVSETTTLSVPATDYFALFSQDGLTNYNQNCLALWDSNFINFVTSRMDLFILPPGDYVLQCDGETVLGSWLFTPGNPLTITGIQLS